jgi:hypothetical protein
MTMKKLKNILEKNPFKVPDNYFEEVNRKIISATVGIEQETRKISLYNRFRPYLLIAASVTGLILITYSAITIVNRSRYNLKLTESYLIENSQQYLNELDIVALEESTASLVQFEEGPDVSKSDIIDYLLLENIEINEIYDQL